MKRVQLGVVSLCVVVLVLSVVWMPEAAAQRRRGPRLEPEKAEAAWKLQAECVANDVGLKKKKAAKLVDAYVASRKSCQESTAKIFQEEGGDRRARMEAYRKVIGEERGKLEAALKGILKEKPLTQAMSSLGTFDGRWDRYVDTLSGLGLGKKEQNKSLTLVNQYVVDSTAAMQKARESGDRESMRGVRRELKEKLDTALAAVLSEEQQAKWTEATARRRRQ